MHVVRERRLGRREGGGRRVEGVGAPAKVHAPAVHRLPERVAQPGVGAAVRGVVPGTQRVGGAHRGREVIGQLELGLLLGRVVGGGAAQQPPRLVRWVQPEHRAGDGRAGIAHRTRADEPVGERQRLPLAVGARGAEPPRPVAAAAAQRQVELLAARRRMALVQVEVRGEAAELDVRLELRGHARHVVDHGAHRVARVGGRERAVEHVDALDLVGRHHAPARREGGAVAQRVRQHDAVGVDHRAGAVARARGAGGEHRVVEVADVALAHQQARQVLERVFGVGRVDRLGDLLGGHAFDGGGDLRRQRGRPATADGDGAERAARGGSGLRWRWLLRPHRRAEGKCHGDRQGERMLFQRKPAPRTSSQKGRLGAPVVRRQLLF